MDHFVGKPRPPHAYSSPLGNVLPFISAPYELIQQAVLQYNEMRDNEPESNSEWLMQRMCRHFETPRPRRNRNAVSQNTVEEKCS